METSTTGVMNRLVFPCGFNLVQACPTFFFSSYRHYSFTFQFFFSTGDLELSHRSNFVFLKIKAKGKKKKKNSTPAGICETQAAYLRFQRHKTKYAVNRVILIHF